MDLETYKTRASHKFLTQSDNQTDPVIKLVDDFQVNQ